MRIELDDVAFFWSKSMNRWRYFDSQKLAMMRLFNLSEGIDVNDYDADIVFSSRRLER